MARHFTACMALALAGALAVLPSLGAAQQGARSKVTSWFGTPTPGPVSDLDKPTFVVEPGAFGPEPIKFKAIPGLSGARMMADVKTITGFSRESRANGDLVWGRITGMPAEKKTVEWAVSRLKAAGLKDARVEEFTLERDLWLPKTSEVKIIADPSFGAGSNDVVLKTAMPLGTSATLAAPITAPLEFIGRGSPAELANVNLKGKIAVINVKPDVTLFSSREKGVAREAIARGAVAAINAVESPGNLQFYDSRYGCGAAPCYAIGGDDGAFLEAVIGKAANAGRVVRATVSVTSESHKGLKGYNGVATIPGKSKEIVIINAHADAWFDGANDNADGLAVMVALAEYFAKSGKVPERTLLFMVSGGHHSGNGPAAFIAAHPDIISNMVLVMNLEHLAQIQVTQAARLDPATGGGYSAGLWGAATTETPKRAGAANSTAYVMELLGRASRVYGVATTYGPSESVPGDLGAYTRTGKPAVQLISSEVYYHSSGDNPSTISQPGLEKAAAFFADFINEVAKAPREKLTAPAGARPAPASGEG